MTTTFLFANNATTTIAAPISAGDTTVTISPGSGNLFPSPISGEQFAFSMVDAATGTRHEVMYCTSRTGDVLTVTRGQEGTTAQTWLVGDFGSNFITAGTAEAFAQNISGAVVYLGTWDANTNAPALTSGVGTSGTYYVVSVAGSTPLDGITIWSIGDWAVFNGTTWEKINGSENEAFNNITIQALTGVVYANGALPCTAASGNDISNAIGAVPVQNANAIQNAAGWDITPTGTKLVFSYNGTDVGSLDSSGNFIVSGDITSQGTP